MLQMPHDSNKNIVYINSFTKHTLQKVEKMSCTQKFQLEIKTLVSLFRVRG